jgi:hypothetical protein
LEKIELENYIAEERVIDFDKAQVGVILYFLPFSILFGAAYVFLWTSQFSKPYLKPIFRNPENWIWAMAAFFIGLVIHELLHGLSWSLFAKRGLKSMHFGIFWKQMMPYCHCKEPLKVKQYIFGTLVPGIVLGIVPSIVAIINGDLAMFLFGFFFTYAACGDFMIVNLLRKEQMDNWVSDHATKIGCMIHRRQ